MTLEDHLTALNACPDARDWARDYPTLRAAWDACERADWLFWYAAKRQVDCKLLVRAACACARTALPHVSPGEDRPLRAIELAERWASGDPVVTLKELRTAADTADAADTAYAADAAAYAADAAAYAAYAADAAAYAAYAAAYAAYAADAAAYAAYAAADAADAADAAAYAAYAAADADADARLHAHRTMCDIVRALILCPEEP